MNNEEKIFQLLTELKQGQDELRQGQDELRQNFEELRQGQDELKQSHQELRENYEELRQGQDELRQGQDELRQGQQELSDRVSGIESHLEHHTDKLLNEMISVYYPMAEKFGFVLERIEGLEFDVDTLKKVVKSHSKDINKLMGVK